MSKKTIAVLFGGQSSEHEVSCISARTIIANLDREQYEPVLVGITKEGRWTLVADAARIAAGTWAEQGPEVVLLPNARRKELLVLDKGSYKALKIEVIFPVLHGLYGEDGTVQGLFELARIPYVGCGVLASAVSMDKLYTKTIVEQLGVRQAKYVGLRREELYDMQPVLGRIEQELDYPLFVKPSNAGSSCGVSKAAGREELIEALNLAAGHDKKILVEEAIVGREVECAVLGGRECTASGIGEVVAAPEQDFYSYEAKYHSQTSRTVIDPAMPKNIVKEIRSIAIKVFRAVDGYGLARVDFFVEEGTGAVVFNEINTMPGFTAISMFPQLWEARGLDKKRLVSRLIELALCRE